MNTQSEQDRPSTVDRTSTSSHSLPPNEWENSRNSTDTSTLLPLNFVEYSMDSSGKIPPVLSWQRLTVLLGALFVTISSGTNYGYSGYAPQLGAKLKLSHTQLNVIGLGGNVGVYSTGPILGRTVDTRGPKILFCSAFALLLVGYSATRYFFDRGLPSPTESISTLTFVILIISGFMTGAGGNAGLTGALNTVAKTFPDRARSTTAGIVLSGFGLSAFFFSEIAHLAFDGEASAYLALLAFGTSIPMLIGYFVIRPIPLPPQEVHHYGEEAGTSSYTPLLNSSREDLLDHETQEQELEGVSKKIHSPNIYGWALWKHVDFWTLFAIMTVLSGTGLMYINNAGSMAQVLYSKGESAYDEKAAARWQATQVSVISVMNFAGRIAFGLLSDAFKRHNHPRSLCLVLISNIFLFSQLLTARIGTVQELWEASASLGLAYGGMFVTMTSLAMDYFGLEHFSENWGYLSLSPMIGGNIFSIAFGRILDAHEPEDPNTLVAGLPSHTRCEEGLRCYIDALYMTMLACTFAVFLSCWVVWKDYRKLRAHGLTAR